MTERKRQNKILNLCNLIDSIKSPAIIKYFILLLILTKKEFITMRTKKL